jgi:hypothetical protein
MCSEVTKLMARLCDLSKISKNEDLLYGNFMELVNPLASLLTQNYIRGCFKGRVHYLIGSSTEDAEEFLNPIYISSDVQRPGRPCKERFEAYLLYFRIPQSKDHELENLIEGAIKNEDEQERLKEDYYTQGEGHVNAIIVDTVAQKIIHLESNGYLAPWQSNAELAVEDFFLERHKEAYGEYDITVGDAVCLKQGPQYLTRDQRCGAWSLLFIFLQASCPALTPLELQQDIVKQGKEKTIRIMQGWLCFLFEYAQVTGLLELYHWIERRRSEIAYVSSFDRQLQQGNLEIVRRMIAIYESSRGKSTTTREQAQHLIESLGYYRLHEQPTVAQRETDEQIQQYFATLPVHEAQPV